MKISKTGRIKNHGPSKLVDKNLEDLRFASDRISWNNQDSSLLLKVPGSDGKSEYIYDVEITGLEIALLVKITLLGTDKTAVNHAIAEGLEAFLCKILSKAQHS